MPPTPTATPHSTSEGSPTGRIAERVNNLAVTANHSHHQMISDPYTENVAYTARRYSSRAKFNFLRNQRSKRILTAASSPLRPTVASRGKLCNAKTASSSNRHGFVFPRSCQPDAAVYSFRHRSACFVERTSREAASYAHANGRHPSAAVLSLSSSARRRLMVRVGPAVANGP